MRCLGKNFNESKAIALFGIVKNFSFLSDFSAAFGLSLIGIAIASLDH
ncbi:hypothetical protein [Nostoc sp.]